MIERSFTLVGENADLDTTKETVWSKGGIYAPVSVAEVCKIVSDDDEDGGAGVITEIEDYSGSVAGTILATCASHGRETGDYVVLTGKYAGTYQVTVVDPNTFYFTAVWDGDDTTIPWVRAEVTGSVSSFEDYSATHAGTVKANCTGHGLVTGDTVIHSNSNNFDGEVTVTVIDPNSYYFTATWAEQTVAWVRAAGGADIQSFADAGGGEVTVNSTAHGLFDGMLATIVSPQFNSEYAVTVVDPNSYKITEVWARETGDYAVTDRSGNITGTADAGGGEVTIYTEDPHGLVDGQEVLQAGTTSYNGTYNITYVDENEYTITETYVANETGTYNATDISDTFSAFDDYSATEAGTTKCTKTAHGLLEGMEITMSNSDNYDGTYTVHYINANEIYIEKAFVAETGTFTYAELSGSFTVEDYSGTQAGTVLGTDTAHGLKSGETIVATSSEGDYDGEKEVTVLTADTLYWTDAYVPETADFSSPEISGLFTEIEDGGAGEIDMTDVAHGLLDDHLITLTSTKYTNSPYTVIKNDADIIAITETWDGDDDTISFDSPTLKVTIPYIKANGVLETEEVELDGTTAVEMSEASKFILAPYVSSGTQTGNITVTNNAGTNDLAYIVAGDTSAKHPQFVVPTGCTGILDTLELDVKTDHTVVFTLESTMNSIGGLTEGVYQEIGSYEVDGIGTRSIDLKGLKVPAGAVITVRAVSATVNASVAFSLSGHYTK